MTKVYVLLHLTVFDDRREETRFIGVYSSRTAARQAMVRLRYEPGFRDTLDGFEIEEYPVDEPNCSEMRHPWMRPWKPSSMAAGNTRA